MRQSSRMFSIATLLITTLLFRSVYAEREGYEIKQWQRNKFWWWSSDAPLTNALDSIPDVVNATDFILHHFTRVEDAIIAELANRTPRRYDVLFQPCTSRDLEDWPRAVDSNFGIRGFPQPDLSCITDVIGVQFSRDEIPPYTVDQLYEAIFRRGAAIQEKAKSIASQLINQPGNFTKPTYGYNFHYDTTSATCVLHPASGGRVDEHWRTSSTIQNRPTEEALILNRRQLFQEFNRVVDGHLTDNAIMRLPVLPKNGTEREIREDATTLITSTRGYANPSAYRNIPIAENPAIQNALEMAAIFIGQGEGVVTPANIAILALPLGLNVIPVSLFSDVGTVQMLLYVVLTDVLTVVPLLIKGIELLHIHGQPHRSVVTRVSSSLNLTKSKAAAGEIWAAECRARDSVRTVGIIFVALSTVFLVVGTILELLARRCLQRRNHHPFEKVVRSESSLNLRNLTEEKGKQLELRYRNAGFVGSSMSLPRSYSVELFADKADLSSVDSTQDSFSGHAYL